MLRKLERAITKASYHLYRLILLIFALIGGFGVFWAVFLAFYGILHLSGADIAKACILLLISTLLSSGSADILERLPNKWKPLDKRYTILRLLERS